MNTETHSETGGPARLPAQVAELWGHIIWNIVRWRKKYFVLGWQEQPRQDKNLLYQLAPETNEHQPRKDPICLSFTVSTFNHRVYRVPCFLSSRPNWLPPPPHPQLSVAPPLVPMGGTHSLAGEGAGIANSDELTGTLMYSRNSIISLHSTVSTVSRGHPSLGAHCKVHRCLYNCCSYQYQGRSLDFKRVTRERWIK